MNSAGAADRPTGRPPRARRVLAREVVARPGYPSRPGARGRTTLRGLGLPLMVVALLAVAALAAWGPGGVPPSRATHGDTDATPFTDPLGAVPRAAPPPSTGGPHPPLSVGSGSEPAPMGLGDPGAAVGGGGPFSTDSFVGEATIDAVATGNDSLGPEAYDFSVQLNAFVDFSYGSQTFVYWAQTVAGINSSNGSVSFFDNVWNATSSPLPTLSSSAIAGQGTVSSFSGGSYYGDGADCTLLGACVTLSFPANLTLRLNASLTGSGQPELTFAYNDGFGFQTFDTARFIFAHGVTDFPGFVVSATQQASGCPRCYGDVEMVVGGPAGGANTTLEGTSELFLGLYDWNGNDYEGVPAGLDHGYATAEGLSNASIALASAANGTPLAELTAGAGTFGTLWTPRTASTVEVSVVTGTAGGTVKVGSSPSIPFLGTSVALEFVPGTYTVSLVNGLTTFNLGTLVLTAGEALTLEVGAPAVVFVPSGLPAGTVWSVTLHGQTLSGTGNLTFGETVGNYSFEVAALSGYSADPSSGNVTVGPTGATVGVDWTSTAQGWVKEVESFFLLRVGPIPLYLLLLILVVGGILAAAIASASRPPQTPWRPPP